MKAAVYLEFQGAITIENLPDPMPSPTGVVLGVKACGICRSDWHGWMGNDPDIRLPHIPGHELAGEVVEVGSDIRNFAVGDRVTLPFVCGCGKCQPCLAGDQQICDHQFQPGFTAWGGFAEFVSIEYADGNLVRLPDEMSLVTAASLGCRFATSFRAVVDQGKVRPEQWVAVFGCGGVGLSAIMIAVAFGARVIAIDISDEKLEFARSIGAELAMNSAQMSIDEAIREAAAGGAHVSIDALGHPEVLLTSVQSLRKRGRHIQVGIMEAGSHSPPIPIDKVIGRELEIIGSHGLPAHRYPEMLKMIQSGKLDPQKLIGRMLTLEEGAAALVNMNSFRDTGVSVIDRF